MKNRVYLILLALAGPDLHGLGIARAVQELSDGRTRLWPASLYGTLDELNESGLIEELDDPRQRPADESEKKRFYRQTRAGPSRAPRGNRSAGRSREDCEVASQAARRRHVMNGYRLLLRLTPRSLRNKHAPGMEALFRQRLAEARERGRVAASIGLAARGTRRCDGISH